MSNLPSEQSGLKDEHKLPKLRLGVTIAFGDYDFEGKPHWLIHDPGRNKFFIIGWVEHEILLRWSTGSAETVITAINSETALQVDLNDIEALVKFLRQNFLLEQSGYQIHQQGKEQKLFKKDNIMHWLISYYLFFRVPLWYPDKFLSRTLHIASKIFDPRLGYFMIGLGIVALYQINMQWDAFTHTFANLFTWQGLFFSLIAFGICKFCHELGHAYMCKHYGVPVPAFGVAFLVFWPVLYTDTTLSWSLNGRERMRIGLAGMWVETYITIIAALTWCNTNNLTLKAICFTTITVNWLGSLLINVSPFMRFDGYYVLADYLRMPNLQFRAFALTRWQLRRWLFDWPDPPPEKFNPRMHYFLVAYSLITWVYRLLLYYGIAILVYHFIVKILGILLFAIELFVFILAPFVTEVKTWIAMKDHFSLNTRTIITLTVTIMSIVLFFLPINTSVKLPATLSYAHQFLVAPENAILATPLPSVDTIVKANQPIIQLKSAELTYSIKKMQLEYTKKLNELRRAEINTSYSSNKSTLLSELNKLQAEYKKIINMQNSLSLKVPFDGVVKEVAPDLLPGTAVMKDEWLGDVIQPQTLLIEGYVPQIDVHLVDKGLTGYFYPHNLSDPSIAVTVVEVDALNSNQLNCQYSSKLHQDKRENIVVDTPCYHSNELGGDLPTFVTDEGNYAPVSSIYRVILLPEKKVPLKNIQRGTVVLHSTPRSYASRMFYWLKKIWIEESTFG
jgi:putative peptide zinc metalloprotease protein